MKERIPTIASILFSFLVFAPLFVVGCKDSSPSDPDIDPIEPSQLELRDVRFTPWVTKPDEPFTLEAIVRGVEGTEIFFYPNPGATLGPDGSLIPNAPSGLIQNGVERDYLVLHKDETYDENQVYLESRFTADNVVLKMEENGVAVSTIWDIRVMDPKNLAGLNLFRVLLPFRSADTAIVGEPVVTQLDEDIFATSRVVNIISDESEEATGYRMRQVSQRYYDLFPDDRDFLVVQKPPNIDTSAGGYFYLSGEREKGLGNDVFRDPVLFGSDGRLKGVIQSLRGVYSLSASGKEDFCLLTHELLHRWAAHMEAAIAREDKHWNNDPTSGLAREHSGFGLDRICKLNDFELYLAGLIPADSVSAPLNQNGYTIDDFINEHGVREPAYPETQRNFNLGFIVESNEPLSDHEMAYFHYIAEEVTLPSSSLSETWYEATGGRSLINSKLPLPVSSSADIYSVITKE